MGESLLYGLGACVVWMLPLFLLRYSSSAVIFHELAAGGLIAGARWALQLAELPHLSAPLALIIFLLMALVLGLEKDSTHGNGVLAFLTAQSGYSLFTLAMGFGRKVPAALGFLLLFALLGWCIRPLFPEKDWREYFANAAPLDKKLDVRLWHVYALMLGQSLLCCIPPALLPVQTTTGRAALLLLLCAVFWGTLLGLCLLIEYRRETMAALIDQQYRQEMQSFMDVIRSQRHDYNFHVQTLAHLLRSGNVAAYEKYVNELVQDSIRMNTLLPIKDPAISATIHNFQTLAAKIPTATAQLIPN